MTEWQPIATAPKDGTKIVLYNKRWLASHIQAFPIGFWEVIGEGYPEYPEDEEAEDSGKGWVWTISEEMGELITGYDDATLWPDRDELDMPTHWMPTHATRRRQRWRNLARRKKQTRRFRKLKKYAIKLRSYLTKLAKRTRMLIGHGMRRIGNFSMLKRMHYMRYARRHKWMK